MEDAAIINLYHLRSERAIAETADKYGAYCAVIAGNILTQPEDREECLNDTWLAAWNDIPPSRPDSLKAYLGRLTRNLAITRWRWAHAEKRYSGPELLLSELEDCVPASGGVEEAVEQKELGGLISRWLDGLGTEDRRLFVRRYWYGVRVKDLAGEAGVRENKIAQRLFRLRKELRRCLEQEGVVL